MAENAGGTQVRLAGNLHVNVMHFPDNADSTRKAHEAVKQIFALALKLGGTLSGEHGVGITKRDYISDELDPAALELMRGLKKLFDPAGILNPHKALPDPEVLSRPLNISKNP